MHSWKFYHKADHQNGKRWLCLLFSFNKHLLNVHDIPGTMISSVMFTWPKTGPSIRRGKAVRTEVSVYKALANEQSSGVAKSGDSGTFFGQPSLKHHILPWIVKQMFSFCLLANRLSASGEHTPCHLRWPKSQRDFSVLLHLLFPLSHLTHLFQGLAQTFLKPQVLKFRLASSSQSSDLNF